jgi:hypothetical protein
MTGVIGYDRQRPMWTLAQAAASSPPTCANEPQADISETEN